MRGATEFGSLNASLSGKMNSHMLRNFSTKMSATTQPGATDTSFCIKLLKAKLEHLTSFYKSWNTYSND